MKASSPFRYTRGTNLRSVVRYSSRQNGFQLIGIRYLANKTPFPLHQEELKQRKKLEKIPKWKQWALYFQSEEFKKGVTVYYVAGFFVMVVCFYFYMRDRYYEDKQLDHIRKKYAKDPASLSEYEYLMLKNFSSDKLKPREVKKYRMYELMRKEFRRKHILELDTMFEPTPQDLEEWYSKQARKPSRKEAAEDAVPELAEEDVESELSNHDNPHIMPPQDTTPFFNNVADTYDDQIKWEERGMFLGKRRHWLMSHAKGDVLEVACGTGRNIPYIKPEKINSITFLDSSAEMVKETQKHFRDEYPKFQNAAFAVGKAEDLQKLTGGDENVRYDTIVEAFGLCAHEDPVKALQNMLALLKPGGRIVLLEHGRSTWNFVNRHLDFRSERRMKTWSCRWNLDIGELVDEAGLDITYEKRVHLGTTWLLVCKRPEDPLDIDEKTFYNKLFGKEQVKIKKS